MKYKIEKNTVQETLILPLYSRKLCTELYPNLCQQKNPRIRCFRQNARKCIKNFGKKREGWTMPALLWVTTAL